jgi:hypothetical protein
MSRRRLSLLRIGVMSTSKAAHAGFQVAAVGAAIARSRSVGTCPVPLATWSDSSADRKEGLVARGRIDLGWLGVHTAGTS